MSGLFGEAPVGQVVQTCTPAPETPDKKKPVHWVEIQLLGEDDKPIRWERYTVVLPDGTKVEGYLDEEGLARVDGIETPGECQVSFPDLDQDAWERLVR
ncbi:MAG: hypothetical protein JNK87_15560 [Bryobacterales bacterium]|nr:hypothetical protein [Bryobacterales bacterium]